MKKYLLILFSFAVATVVKGQGNYYEGQTIYIDPALTFKCYIGMSTNSFMLENLNDTVIYSQPMAPSNLIAQHEAIKRRNMRVISNDAFLNAFFETFTMSELNQMSGHSVLLGMEFNQQGNIADLAMTFDRTPYFMSISPQKYATLYKKLKAYIKVKVEDPRIYYWGFGSVIQFDKIINRELVLDPSRYVSASQYPLVIEPSW